MHAAQVPQLFMCGPKKLKKCLQFVCITGCITGKSKILHVMRRRGTCSFTHKRTRACARAHTHTHTHKHLASPPRPPARKPAQHACVRPSVRAHMHTHLRAYRHSSVLSTLCVFVLVVVCAPVCVRARTDSHNRACCASKGHLPLPLFPSFSPSPSLCPSLPLSLLSLRCLCTFQVPFRDQKVLRAAKERDPAPDHTQKM